MKEQAQWHSHVMEEFAYQSNNLFPDLSQCLVSRHSILLHPVTPTMFMPSRTRYDCGLVSDSGDDYAGDYAKGSEPDCRSSQRLDSVSGSELVDRPSQRDIRCPYPCRRRIL